MSQHFEFTRTGVWTWLTSGSWLKGHITAFERSQCQEVASGSCSSLQSKWRVGFSVSLNSHTNQQKCPISSSSNFESVITSLDASIPMYIYINTVDTISSFIYIYIYMYDFCRQKASPFPRPNPFCGSPRKGQWHHSASLGRDRRSHKVGPKVSTPGKP